jgi:carbon-monoxide dehydrogenase large subunit
LDDLELVDGSVSVRGAPERRVSLGELAQASANGVLRAEETYSLAGRNAFSGGAHAALVEVDPETGLVQVRRYVVVDDCGTLLNPTVVEGQAHGGVAHGLGNALLERLVYAEDGRLLSSDLPDYAVPATGSPVAFGSSAEHQPRYRTSVPDILIEHLDQRSSHNPEGIKGAGEGGVIGSLPALVAAVEDALAPFGVRLQELPVRPEHLVRAHEAIVRSVPVAG